MSAELLLAAMAPAAYIAGSIPFGLLVGLARGVDPRLAGSKNIGATNVGRLLGGRYFAAVFILDLLKGLIPCLIGGAILRFSPASGEEYVLWMLVGAAAVLGHVFSIFLRFKGGKGVATSTGILLGIWPYFTLPAMLAIATFLAVFKATRYVSASSIAGAAAFPLFYIIIALAAHWPLLDAQAPLLIASFALAGLIVYRHRANIARLRAGTELRVGQSRQP